MSACAKERLVEEGRKVFSDRRKQNREQHLSSASRFALPSHGAAAVANPGALIVHGKADPLRYLILDRTGIRGAGRRTECDSSIGFVPESFETTIHTNAIWSLIPSKTLTFTS
jgi:hypothetical protein